MSLKNPSMNFYDSDNFVDFDSRNESKFLDDTDDLLNKAFIASPGKSISCLLDDSSLSNLRGMLDYNDEKEHQKKIRDQKINELSENKQKSELSCQGNRLKTTDVFLRKRSPSEGDIKLYSIINSAYLDLNERNWVSHAKRNLKPKFGDFDSEIETESSEKTCLSKKNEEKAECNFLSTYLQEIEKTTKEYWSKFDKRSFFEMEDESEKFESKIKVPVQRSDYEYHELSTIPEVDSVFMDESDESLMNSNKYASLLNQESKITKLLKANDSFDAFIKQNAPSKFPVHVMKVIQNKHIERLLQEPGILEESDLTLISTNLDSLSRIAEKSNEQDEESPSLISFLQHEISCMKDSTDE